MATGAGLALAAAALLGLQGCATLGYYWQSAAGHLHMMSAARPVQDWLEDEQTPAPLKDRLVLSQRIRAFAVKELGLPDNPSYRRYADLQRSAVVWNVVAAPAFSLTLKTWCFPVAGCVGYRGYFDETEARALADALTAQGYDASAYPVPAYSTLGWMNWAGGDPLLNTFINYPEGELARLLFHELAHQVLYVKDDTMFNESFATAVERIGIARWLATQAPERARRDYTEFDDRRAQFRALTRETREALQRVYDAPTSELTLEQRQAAKEAVMRGFRERYAQLRAGWGGEAARLRNFDRWVAQANNAAFGAQAAYDDLVPGFEALFLREGGDWSRFYAAAQRLAAMPRAQRHQILKERP